jgi:hypothetical protein
MRKVIYGTLLLLLLWFTQHDSQLCAKTAFVVVEIFNAYALYYALVSFFFDLESWRTRKQSDADQEDENTQSIRTSHSGDQLIDTTPCHQLFQDSDLFSAPTFSAINDTLPLSRLFVTNRKSLCFSFVREIISSAVDSAYDRIRSSCLWFLLNVEKENFYHNET